MVRGAQENVDAKKVLTGGRATGVPSMLTATLENHTRMRRMFSPAFSDRAIKSQEPLFKQ
mgnify:CR=1 FL=1